MTLSKQNETLEVFQSGYLAFVPQNRKVALESNCSGSILAEPIIVNIKFLKTSKM